MNEKYTVDSKIKVLPMISLIIGIGLFIAQFVTRLNMVAVICVGYMCVMSAIILIGLIAKKKVYLHMLLGYASAALAVFLFHVIFGADAGFGAFTSGLAGWTASEHTLSSGAGNFFTRLFGNLLLTLPLALSLFGLYMISRKSFKKIKLKGALSFVMSILLVATSVIYVLTMNMRTRPVTERMWDGQDEYLKGVDKKQTKGPNVIVILTDDLGWGDVSLNGSIFDTPNIDSIGENGLNFDNFYSSYSVCSPARFALMTGRYPYRGYADNVIYPTVQSIVPFAQTRIFNSVELGANVDGMLGDEITMAEVFKAAGYNTGIFGKWHLGDYGEYLPTNQGFDYFYGSHHVNDMNPFYHVREENGDYTIVRGTDELKDQSKATEYISDELISWVTNQVENSDEPFLAYYTTPWPHAPIFVGNEFDGKTGMGQYVDCVTEFDASLGKLFAKLEELGVMEDTIIVFTSDNGPALQGSVGELRGGKYLAYEGGQKVPFMIRWDNNGGLFEKGETRSQSATLVDLFPTLIDLCGITGNGGQTSYLPADREIDGVSMLPVLKSDSVIHTEEHPILHMKREDIKAIQYTVSTESVKNRSEYADYDYPVLNDNEFITFKYFDKIQNDNSAFFDKYRKNWLHILTDDVGENYNRTTVYPTIADEMHAKLDEIQKNFKENRRGITK
ncbi:MAG: sulfatase-like hydrolase/transferase [Acutalibacteraceae bacterium]